jgi:hypothetical protein
MKNVRLLTWHSSIYPASVSLKFFVELPAAKPATLARDANLSPNLKWRTLPKVPPRAAIRQHRPYFGRAKVKGKPFS